MTGIRETSQLDALIVERIHALIAFDPVVSELERERRNALIRDRRREADAPKPRVEAAPNPALPPPPPPPIRLLGELEREAILEACRQLGAHRASTALGIGKTTIYRKLHDYGVDPRSFGEGICNG